MFQVTQQYTVVFHGGYLHRSLTHHDKGEFLKHFPVVTRGSLPSVYTSGSDNG